MVTHLPNGQPVVAMITWLGTTKWVASIGVWQLHHLPVVVMELPHQQLHLLPPTQLLVQLMPNIQLGIKISTAMISSTHQNVTMMVVTAVSKKDGTGIVIAMYAEFNLLFG